MAPGRRRNDPQPPAPDAVISFPERSLEERTLFNPAFLALNLSETARGHLKETEGPLPFPLAFLTIALSTHDRIVETLPTIATSMLTWIDREPLARVQVTSRAQELVPATREAIRIGAQSGVIKIAPDGGISHGSLRRAPGTGELKSSPNVKASYFIGRWVGRIGDPTTCLNAWGLSV